MAPDSSLPKAIVVCGAGTEEVNGVYKATTREYCDAPVYEHMERGSELKLTREPHKNPKTGVVKHGWLLGQNKTPLYGAPTESLAVPESGWKKFSGQAPVPTVKVMDEVHDVYFKDADAAKSLGDEGAEKEDWAAARDAYSDGINALKKSGERFGDAFQSRAALLLSRRATAHFKLKEPKPALRDAIAALELTRDSPAAETVAVQAAKELGCSDDAMVKKMLDQVGLGKVLDPGAPLVLRCIERWTEDCIDTFKAQGASASLPAATHIPADRYLDGLTEEQRTEVLKRYLPEALPKPDGGSAVLANPRECLELMKKWEGVLNGDNFKELRDELWDAQGVSHLKRLRQIRELLVEVLADVNVQRGFAEGQPGLTRCIEQMKPWWSVDKHCARKALDLEEMASISLADLEE